MRNIINLTVRLTVIMLIAALCLGATDMLTREPIKQQRAAVEEELRRAVIEQLGEVTFEKLDLPGDAPETILGIYKATSSGGEGYVFALSKSGFGGPISMMVGILADGTVSGVRIASHTETPGLGAKAEDEAFYGQYAGKDAQSLSVIKSGETGSNEIAAITAATVTSQAVTDAVNAAIDTFNAHYKGALA